MSSCNGVNHQPSVTHTHTHTHTHTLFLWSFPPSGIRVTSSSSSSAALRWGRPEGCGMCERVRPLGPEALVVLLEAGLDRVLLIDTRPFTEFNACHILEAVNVNCSKLMKRRLQQDKIHITELLLHSAKRTLELQGQEVVVYDQSSSDPASLSPDAFLSVLLAKLVKSFPSVHLLSGGFSGFCGVFPALCEGKASPVLCVSQPCVAVSSGPTRILPHLYLGCQRDVLSPELMQQNDITFVLNASISCPKPDSIPDSQFLRVPVNDSFCEQILPWLDRSVEFIERAKAGNARVLVHCLAGISRSATIAIAYIMTRMDMSLDEAYRFVKEKRPTISPNFNFLGQLLDFEKRLKSEAERMGRALCGLRLEEDPEESTLPTRRFSLDIRPLPDTPLQTGRSVCELQERDRSVCELQEGDRSVCELQRSGSVDAGSGGWFLLESGVSSGLRAPGRGRQRLRDSRRSWHEESSFEKQLKRRSCQMELGDGVSDPRSGDELAAPAAQDRFSGSMEIIQVS